MLSPQELHETQEKYDNIPKAITGKFRKNLRAIYRKKLHEHYLASNFPPFQPSTYEQYFINYKTDELILLHLIEMTSVTKYFTVDTESVCIPHKPNKPSLIQIQLILPTLNSYIIFIEVWHLPRTNTSIFALVREFFNTLFNPRNIVYIWGSISELDVFIEFNLFSWDQIRLSKNINFQEKFKKDWQKAHPHREQSSLTTYNEPCKCETCLDMKQNNLWSIQNAVAYQLGFWLDKRYNLSQFDIGLDETLYHLTEKQIEHRHIMTCYAAYDCLAIQALLINLNIFDEIPIDLPEQQAAYEVISDDNEQEPLIDDQIISIKRPVASLEPASDAQQPRQQLSEQERKQIHNRSCTLKQRERSYKHEIICHNIDWRFPITNIKNILRDKNVEFNLVNTAKSLSNTLTLFIGIKNPSFLSKYKEKIQDLFSTENYNRFYRNQHSSRSSSYRRNHH